MWFERVITLSKSVDGRSGGRSDDGGGGGGVEVVGGVNGFRWMSLFLNQKYSFLYREKRGNIIRKC